MRHIRLWSLVLVIASCGGKVEEHSGFDRGRDLATFSLDERAALCDWAASITGGYGNGIACGRGIGGLGNALDQPTCLSLWADTDKRRRSCAMTVGQLEDCLNAYNDIPSRCAIATSRTFPRAHRWRTGVHDPRELPAQRRRRLERFLGPLVLLTRASGHPHA